MSNHVLMAMTWKPEPNYLNGSIRKSQDRKIHTLRCLYLTKKTKPLSCISHRRHQTWPCWLFVFLKLNCALEASSNHSSSKIQLVLQLRLKGQKCHMDRILFQQDGVTCHTTRETVQLLYESLLGRVVSHFSDQNRPLRTCDLTPLELFYFKIFWSFGLMSTMLLPPMLWR